MRPIELNLARDRRVDNRAFAWRAAALAGLALLLGGLGAANLARQARLDRGAAGTGLLQAGAGERMAAESARLRSEIEAWRRTRGDELAAANRLIARKGFSFVRRLDLLEKAFRPGLRLRQLSLANEASGRTAMTVSAQTLRDLFALYKNLAPYDLAISSEAQAQGDYQVNLSVRLDHETP
jgi:hypothetical protein